LDGSDRIAFGTGVNMAGQAALTVLAGVRYAGGGTDEHTILNNWSNTAAGIIFRIDPTTTPANRVEAFVRATGDTQIGGTASLTVTPDTWTTVGMRYSAAGLFAVKNGSTESLAAYGGAMDADASAALYAGRYSDLFPTTEFFTGSMENLLISFEAKSEAYLGAWHSTWDAPGTFSTAGSVEDETPPPPPPPASVNMAGIRPTGTYATGTELLWASAPAAIPLEIAQESDAAVSLLLARALQVAEETSAAFNLLMAQVLGVAVESGEAVQLLQPGALEAAQETDEAVALVLITPSVITAAEEQDQAVALLLIVPITLGVAVESNAAVVLVLSGGAPAYAQQPETVSSWSYQQTATLWRLTGRADWTGARTFAAPVLFLCDYMREGKTAVNARGEEFMVKLTAYTSLPGIKPGDMVLIGSSDSADPVSTDAEEVQAVVSYGDTFNAGGAEDFKILA
jgi:hypothetical protein